MKKIILLFILLFALPACGEILTGEVKYTVDDARIELRQNRPSTTDYLINQNNFVDKDHVENYSALLKGQTKLNDRTMAIFSDGSYALNYKNDLAHVWYYDKDGLLISAEERTSFDYPYKSYKYTPDGELINMGLRVSEKETFIFSPLGQLLGHWIDEKCYDENGNVVLTRNVLK